jgi:uncharacterized membrane protein YeiH
VAASCATSSSAPCPPVGISDWRLLAAAGCAAAVTFFASHRVEQIERAVVVLDAAGLGLFAVAGTLKALQLGTSPLTAVIVGVLTGVGGGVDPRPARR